jgi:hypothetical protein
MIWVLPTPVQPTLAQTQATQINALNASYQAAITAPISFTTTAGVTATFPQDAQAKTYLNQCLVAGAASKVWPLNLWLDVSGTPVSPFTYADLQNLASAMELAELPEYHDLLTKIAAVQAASTVADVQAITL